MLVDDLHILWRSVCMDYPRGLLKMKWIQAALMNVACDTPAIRKVLQLVGLSPVPHWLFTST